ncbi:MAG: hypothetical protein Q8R55_06195 [Candidatus Taylorbacteria bacterium]|nr:hypothetical protein [Candidatus Taylorbacteria bacterium]
MTAHYLVGRKFEVLDVNKTNEKLTITLRDLDKGTSHRFTAGEESGPGADSNWYNWTEVRFDGGTLLKT